MLESELAVNRFLLGYCRMMTSDLPDDRFTEQPMPGVNHPAWILGHLTLTADRACALLGGSSQLPTEWTELFGMGSKLASDRSRYPSKDELLAKLEQTHLRLQELVAAAGPEQWAKPSTNPRTKQHLPTVKDGITFLLTGHLGVHLGQLSTWRRMIGLPPLF